MTPTRTPTSTTAPSLGRGPSAVAWIAVAVATAVLVTLALTGIAVRSFWYDEAISIEHARESVAAFIASITTLELNGSLYYAVLRAWHLLGDDEATIRALSVVFAALTVPALFVVGRRHVGTVAAVIGCGLFAMSPFVIEYAREGRMYAMAALAATLTVLAWSKATESDRARWWTAFVVVGGASVYVHLFCGFVVAGLAVTWALGLVERTRRGGLALMVVAGIALPMVVFAALSGGSQVAWIRPFADLGVSAVLGRVGGGSVVLSIGLYLLAGLGIVAAAGPSRRRLAPIVAWWLAPVAAGLLISVWRSLLEPRYFLVALPPLLLLVGAGLAAIARAVAAATGRRTLGGLVLGASLVAAIGLAVGPMGEAYAREHGDWRSAADWVARTADAGDRVVFVADRARYPFGLYLERAGPVRPVESTLDAVRIPTSAVWLVLYRPGEEGYRAALAALADYRLESSKRFGDVRVQWFTPVAR